jgi:hypothetical protein
MPRSRETIRALAIASSSRNKPIAAKIGTARLELAVGVLLCATAQIEQEADSVRVG